MPVEDKPERVEVTLRRSAVPVDDSPAALAKAMASMDHISAMEEEDSDEEEAAVRQQRYLAASRRAAMSREAKRLRGTVQRVLLSLQRNPALERTLKELDSSGDGTVSRFEFGAALHRMGIILAPQDAEHVFRELDSSGDGLLDRHELLCALQPKYETAGAVVDEPLRDYFNRTASRKGEALGAIAPGRQLAAKLRKHMPKEGRAAYQFVMHILKRYDGDGDGSLTAEEMKRGLSLFGADLTRGERAVLAEAVVRETGEGEEISGASIDRRGQVMDIHAVASLLLAPDLAETLGDADGSRRRRLRAEAAERKRKARLAKRRPASSGRFAEEQAAASRRWEQFKVEWTERYGKAAEKELRMDASRKPPGPTWTSAQPRPFRVVRLRAAPPSPRRGRR
eukprot:PLAT8669.1.p1 GENE.PLAT8669.1~~PLAT8669.1.p1  ORF type:complete len:396 (-),score=194.62 PLAT8669.1:28-1215(-)